MDTKKIITKRLSDKHYDHCCGNDITDGHKEQNILLPRHIGHLKKEGFTCELIAQWQNFGLRSLSTEQAYNLGFLLKQGDQYVSGSGLYFPFTSSFGQLRLDTPITREDGSIAKYLTPLGASSQACIPEGCQVVTEGAKDGRAGTVHGGIPTGAIAGVSHYRKALPSGCGYTILFDADGWTNPSVMNHLFNAGLWVKGKIQLLPEIEGQPKAGLCEYFKAGYTSEDYKALIASAYKLETLLLEWGKRFNKISPERIDDALSVAFKLAVRHLKPAQQDILKDDIKKSSKLSAKCIKDAFNKASAQYQAQKEKEKKQSQDAKQKKTDSVNLEEKVIWPSPQSFGRTIGFWKNDPELGMTWEPRCNFDLAIELELSNSDGGGFVFQVLPMFDDKQYRVIIRNEDLKTPDSFQDALCKAMRCQVRVSLTKWELNSLIADRQYQYRKTRGGQVYQVCDRYGQQSDGTWVFENIQFTKDGKIVTESDTKIIFDPQLGTEDFIPCPRLAEPNGLVGLSSLIGAGREVFGSANTNQFLLTIGWVIAALNFQTIIKTEGHFPIFNAHGVPGSCKTIASEAALSLVGINWSDEGMISNASRSAIYERLSKTGSLPVIWDDPPRKEEEKLDEFCKAMWNAKSRVVRGNHQKPHSPVGFTTNHVLAGNQDAAWTRIFRCLYEIGGNTASFPKLKAAMKIASGSFSSLLKIGYHPEEIKPIQNHFLARLPFAHARISWTLGLITWYAEQVVELVGGDENPRQWVLDNLIESENDSEYSGDSLADFARCLIALEGKDRVGSWNKREYTESDGVKWVAIHAQSCWEEVDKAYKPTTYNKKSLKALLLKSGGKQKTVRFDISRDLVLDYQRELRRFVPGTYINEKGEEVEKEAPRPPKTKDQKAWLIPSKYFDLPSDDDWGCDQNQEDVTNCDQNLVTGKNHVKSSVSASYNDDVTIVTKKEEEEELEKKEKISALGDLPNSERGTRKNFSSPQKVDLSPEKMVTTVTESKNTENQGFQPVTNSGHNWSDPVTLVTTESEKEQLPPANENKAVTGVINYSTYPHLTSKDIRASAKRANKCKSAMLSCTNQAELAAWREEGGFSSNEIDWVYRNLLNDAQKDKVCEAASSEQLDLFVSQDDAEVERKRTMWKNDPLMKE